MAVEVHHRGCSVYRDNMMVTDALPLVGKSRGIGIGISTRDEAQLKVRWGGGTGGWAQMNR